MFKCKECGCIFEEGEQYEWEETHGLNTPPFEKFSGCPKCHGDYDEVIYCKICGMPYTKNELYSGICDNCIDEAGKDWKTIYKMAKEDKQTERVYINSFLVFLFDADEVNRILYEYLEKHFNTMFNSEYLADFVNSDRQWFADMLLEQAKKRGVKNGKIK